MERLKRNKALIFWLLLYQDKSDIQQKKSCIDENLIINELKVVIDNSIQSLILCGNKTCIRKADSESSLPDGKGRFRMTRSPQTGSAQRT